MADLGLAVTILGTLVTIGAVCVAIWQHRASTKHAREHKKSLASLADKLSTQYIGTFPEYLPKLNDLICSVSNKLVICSTIPIQGFFNAPDDWLELKQQLDRLRRTGHGVEAILSDRTSRRKYLEEQFRGASGEGWNSWRKERLNAEKLQRFVQVQQLPVGTLDTLTSEQFFHLLETCAASDFREISKGATKAWRSPFRHFLNIWVADGRRAMFAFPVTKPDFVNHAFWTKDGDLIRALLSTCEQYKQISRLISPRDSPDGRGSRED